MASRAAGGEPRPRPLQLGYAGPQDPPNVVW